MSQLDLENHTYPVMNDDPTHELRRQINQAASIVGVTFGPNGGLVLIQDDGGEWFSTDDGVTVIGYLRERKSLQPGAKMLYDGARSVADLAGDGTTTVCLLVQYLLQDNLDITPDLPAILEYLEDNTIECDDQQSLIDVATTATESEVYGKMIGEMVHELGIDGHITPMISDSVHSEIEDGYFLPAPLLSPNFLMVEHKGVSLVKNERVRIDNPLVIIVAHEMNGTDQISAIIGMWGEQFGYDRPLILIAPQIDSQAMSLALYHFAATGNDIEKKPIYILGAPYMKEPDKRYAVLTDMAFVAGLDSEDVYSALTGRSIDKDGRGLAKETFGSVDYAILENEKAHFVTSRALDERKAQIKMGDVLAAERKSSLSGKMGTIYFGSPTLSETRNINLIIEDGVLSAHAALKNGYLEGGKALWNGLSDEFPQYAHVFENLSAALPETRAYDTRMSVEGCFKAAASLVGQILNTRHVLHNEKL